jgi:hypothetical protein
MSPATALSSHRADVISVAAAVPSAMAVTVAPATVVDTVSELPAVPTVRAP